ncbi:hypothetical protein DSO57_1009707 [Entomophthora muscae]|uniref:Uncharacterized protein n=1 Tax=Entomophthora muscae TaxID=34485 RepID=A0ACC2UG38_9FUNG|nr:hypothetical protein DSO57_1009707 [Entomophthora muscae]
MVESMVHNSGPWSLIGQSVSYIIKLAPSYGGHYPLARLYSVLSQLMSLPMPGFLTISGEALFKSLTCNDLNLHAAGHTLLSSLIEKVPVSSPLNLESNSLVPLQEPMMSVPVPTCMSWLLTGLVLMGLNVYFPQFSHVSSLWTSLRAAVPVLHWAASWWFVSPG